MMTKFKSVKDFFEMETPKDIQRFVDKNLDISVQVHDLLLKKGWTQSDLAKVMGKSTAEVSKWLSGTHNITLRSIARMEAALDADIILTVRKAEKRFDKVEYVILEQFANTNHILNLKFNDNMSNINFALGA